MEDKLEAHPRRLIREKIVELLAKGGTLADDRVFDSRDYSLNADNPSAIIIYTQEEQLDAQESQDLGLRRRIMTVSVECYHIGENGAGAVDNIAWQAENILHANPTLDNLVEWCVMQSASIAFADDGQHTLHAALLSFEVTYCTHLYRADDGTPPKTVLVGFVPETGSQHKDGYVDLGEA